MSPVHHTAKTLPYLVVKIEGVGADLLLELMPSRFPRLPLTVAPVERNVGLLQLFLALAADRQLAAHLCCHKLL